MSVSKGFTKCLELMENMVKRGYVSRISRKDLERFITMFIGADERTIQKYEKMLLTFNFLKVSRMETHPKDSRIYRVNLSTIQTYMNQYMKGKLSQLRLLDLQMKEEKVIRES